MVDNGTCVFATDQSCLADIVPDGVVGTNDLLQLGGVRRGLRIRRPPQSSVLEDIVEAFWTSSSSSSFSMSFSTSAGVEVELLGVRGDPVKARLKDFDAVPLQLLLKEPTLERAVDHDGVFIDADVFDPVVDELQLDSSASASAAILKWRTWVNWTLPDVPVAIALVEVAAHVGDRPVVVVRGGLHKYGDAGASLRT